jgi:hypothetical protein
MTTIQMKKLILITKTPIVHRRGITRAEPQSFRLPVRHGMYEKGAITLVNADKFHLAEDYPVKKK